MSKYDEAAVEAEIQAKGLTSPRLTPADIDAAIAGEDYHVFSGTTLTVCCLTLRNGFTVTGESACASPANFDPALGRRIARDSARNKIWALEGYLLREKLHQVTLEQLAANGAEPEFVDTGIGVFHNPKYAGRDIDAKAEAEERDAKNDRAAEAITD